MKYEIKSVEIWGVGRTIFMISLIIHLVLGVTVLLIILIGMNVATSLIDDIVYLDDDMVSGGFGIVIGLLLVVMISFGSSIIYALFYVTFGALYNLFAGWLGGVEITLEESAQSVKTVLIPKDDQVSEDDVSEEDSPEE